MSDILKEATELAETAHDGQERFNGDPYINHPLRVSKMLKEMGEVEWIQAVGVLHDALEDCPDNLKQGLAEDMIALSPEVFHGVRRLTHIENTPYQDYIGHVCEYPRLAVVKLVDILDNLTEEPTMRQREKYRKALPIILSTITQRYYDDEN
jgi:GTP pyrophosphokinase